jgi:succinate dehydrogenase/fumarate reductase cytochrome b subunit
MKSTRTLQAPISTVSLKANTMFILVHRFTGKALLRFLTLEEALVALQEAAVPDLFYISNQAN